MPDFAAAIPLTRRFAGRWRPAAPGGEGARWLPVWSVPAALRAVRATIVVPGLFALTFEVIGDEQMALFAVFGSFASLVMASFGGTRRDKAIAHLGLAVTGSAVLIIGTAVSGVTWLAAVVTIPVAFAIFFAGMAGPNAASGVTAALLAYVLPVASAAPLTTLGPRLAGWWLASAVSTAAVLLLSPRSAGERLRAATGNLATTLASQLEAAARGDVSPALAEASLAAKHELMDLFAATPYRPIGLTTADQALANAIQLLEWCASLVLDTLDGHLDMRQTSQPDLELLGLTADLLRDVAALLNGRDVRPGLEELGKAQAVSSAHLRGLVGDPAGLRACAVQAVHAQAIAVAARAAGADTLVAARRADPETIDAERRRWIGVQAGDGRSTARFAGLAGLAGIVARHASLRSVWFLNSARGAVALAAAVAVADLSGVQHGFWVVLGTLSVLRTSATATGSTAMRALLGTVAGFAIGAALLLAIGTGPAALWAALPVAVLVASYAPGTAPFAVGQAAFTVTVVVLFNLLVPAGWQVGLLRIQDVAIGCAVSLVVGILFWPRGASLVVGDDLADAFRRGAAYLTQAVDWVLGLRALPPDAGMAAATAGIRLDDALRGYLAEQGSKRVTKSDLWSLVMGTMRVRLSAYSLAGLRASGAGQQRRASPGRNPPGEPGGRALSRQAAELAGFYQRIAAQVGSPSRQQPARLAAPVLGGPGGPGGPGGLGDRDGPAGSRGGAVYDHPHALWVREYLHHLGSHAAAMTEPAARVAALRHTPWWR